MPFTGLSDVSTYAGAKPFFGSKPAYFDFSSSNFNVQGHKTEHQCGCSLPKSISTGAQYVTPESKIYCEKVKMCRFSSGNLVYLQSLVEGATQLCTFKKECNKLDLTAAQYFWLVECHDWSRWFAISSSHIHAVPVTVLLVGLPKKIQLYLDI